jgi:beta-lactamase class A
MEYIGIDYINAFFDKCGLPDIRLRRKLYDMEGIAKGIRNIISARSLVKLLLDLEKRSFLREEFALIGLDILSKQQISDNLQKYATYYYDENGNCFRYPIKMCTKSGWDDTVKHDCGIIYTPKSTIILGILTKNMYTPDAAELIGRFAELSIQYFDPESLVKTYKNED